MRGYSQLALSRRARIGKSQLCKYERGRELPKMETLEKVLSALEVPPISFFYTVAMLDDLIAKLDGGAAAKGSVPVLLPLTTIQPGLGETFALTMRQLMRLYHLQLQVQASPAFERLFEPPEGSA
jgi:transcriptional regulator with XRE-family HTH domain